MIIGLLPCQQYFQLSHSGMTFCSPLGSSFFPTDIQSLILQWSNLPLNKYIQIYEAFYIFILLKKYLKLVDLLQCELDSTSLPSMLDSLLPVEVAFPTNIGETTCKTASIIILNKKELVAVKSKLNHGQ